jgi:RND family efflux transporter MFP subunit
MRNLVTMKTWQSAPVTLVVVLAGCNRADAKKDALPPAADPAAAPVCQALGGRSRSRRRQRTTPESSRHGHAAPAERAQLGPKSSGVIAAINVEEGDRVKKGQVLFRLDSRQAQLAVEQAKTAVASAKVAEQTAEVDFNRTKQLFEKGNVAQAAYDQAKARVDGAKAAVDQANAAVALAKKVAADSAVQSPSTGGHLKLKNVGETASVVRRSS